MLSPFYRDSRLSPLSRLAALAAWFTCSIVAIAGEYQPLGLDYKYEETSEASIQLSEFSQPIGCDAFGDGCCGDGVGCGHGVGCGQGGGFASPGAGAFGGAFPGTVFPITAQSGKPWSFSFTQTVDYGTNLTLPIALTPLNTVVAPLSDPLQIGIVNSIGLLDPLDPVQPVFEDDFQFQTQAIAIRTWEMGNDASFSAGYGYYHNLHPSVKELDLLSHTVLANYSRRLGDRLVGALDYNYVYYYLDGDSFVSQNNISPNVLYQLNDRWDYRGGFSYGNANFRQTPFLNSDNYAVTGEAIRYLDSQRQNFLMFGTGYGISNAADDAFSYDVPNFFVGGRWLFGWDRRNEFRIIGSYFDYKFQGDDPVDGVRRRDHIYTINPVVARAITEHLSLFASYVYLNSNSNVARQDFDQNLISLGATCHW